MPWILGALAAPPPACHRGARHGAAVARRARLPSPAQPASVWREMAEEGGGG
jgi:hypothetical protein